jgi:hypothetical protein
LENRTCIVCKIEKADTEFYAGQGNTCKKCNNEKARAWKKENPQRYKAAKRSREAADLDHAVKRRKNRLKRRYKLTLTQVNEILEGQGHKCLICQTPLISPSVRPSEVGDFEDAEWAVVDHDHKDGHVRGALCSSCNAALGLFRDDLKILYAA